MDAYIASSPNLPAVLYHAASRNWDQMLIEARENPASLLTIDEASGYTSLHYCARERAPDEIIKRLLSFEEARRTISISCREGSWTPIHLSCRAIASDETIVALARANPAAMLIQDSDGDNVLHCALRNGSSAEVLSVLIDLAADVTYLDSDDDALDEIIAAADDEEHAVNPNPFLAADYGDGDAPIHSAIRHEAPTSVVELLLDAAPDCIDAQNCELKLPIHLACEFERHDVIGVLCQRVMDMPGREEDLRSYLAVEDWYGTAPVACLWDQYLDKCVSTKGRMSTEPSSRMQIDLWESIVRLLTSAYYGQEVDFDPRCRSRSQVQMLAQAAIGIGDVCPPTFLKFLVRRYPSVVSTEDAAGNLPLVEAIVQGAADANSATSHHPDMKRTISTPTTKRNTEILTTVKGKKCLNTSVPSKQDREYDLLHPSSSKILREDVIKETPASETLSAVQIVIDANPKAAFINDSSGHLPLALAALSGLPWNNGTDAIFKANPQAVGRKDNVTGLHAFMLAASAPFQNEVDHVDTVFNLLRLDPSVIEGHSRRSKKKESSSKKRTGTRANIDRSSLSGGRKKARQLQT